MATNYDNVTTNYVGRPTSRVDGRAKVTGAAKYSAEFDAPRLAYGYVVSGAIAKGRITRIDAARALAVPGVLQVFTHENRPKTAWLDRSYKDQIAPSGSPLRPLYDAEIKYSGQPVALVVAEDFETARFAASLVRVEYDAEPHVTDLDEVREEGYDAPRGKQGFNPPPKPRGDAERAFESAAVQFEAEYSQPIEHHNPMEMHASTVVYEPDGKLTIYDKTQGTENSRDYVCSVFDLSKSDVRVVTQYMGGGFGSGLRPQYQLFLAVMAALELKRPVRVTLTRDQMFTFSHRPNTLQRLMLGASADGTLEAVRHDALAETSRFEDHTEVVVNWSGLLYKCDNVRLSYKLAKLDLHSPADMRAPGGATGVFALESAMDELAYRLGIDPLELRLKNYSEHDQNTGKQYSSKELRECYRQGAERFGWAKRNPQPRSMRAGEYLIGQGVATGVWEYHFEKSSAKIVLTADGKLDVTSAVTDIGTGTYTIMAQIAADTLGLPLDRVTARLGDTILPKSIVEGGSMTAAAVGSAVKAACEKAGEQLLSIAQEMEEGAFADASLKDVTFAEGRMKLKRDPSVFVPVTELMRLGRLDRIEKETAAGPLIPGVEPYSQYTHSAVFAEVKVDEDLGTVRVTRVVNAVAGGRVLNPKTARSQIIGGVVWGVGMALEEESVVDQQFGRIMNHNLAEYHIPVCADVEEIDVIFVEEHDEHVNPLGAKGLGEIGVVGTAAAIANAVFHATGKRVRDLPVTLDKLL